MGERRCGTDGGGNALGFVTFVGCDVFMTFVGCPKIVACQLADSGH